MYILNRKTIYPITVVLLLIIIITIIKINAQLTFEINPRTGDNNIPNSILNSFNNNNNKDNNIFPPYLYPTNHLISRSHILYILIGAQSSCWAWKGGENNY